MSLLTMFAAKGIELKRSWLCRLLQLPRSTFYYQPRPRARNEQVDEVLAERVWQLLERFPAFGIRSVWSWLYFQEKLVVNHKKVERLMRIKGWTLKARRAGRRPRVQVTRSITERPDERWATDLAMVQCGEDGWCHFVPVIDCCTREILGWELDPSARAKPAERALETALLTRFGWLHGAPAGLTLRHDNGLVFGSRLYRGTVREYGLQQEYITPYTPEENGLCERFIRTFKEQCVWLHRFNSLEHARRLIAAWIQHYNAERPHQALGYLTPQQQYQQCIQSA